MNGNELLAALEAAGATLELADGDIRVTVASRALTPEMRAALREDKAPLLSAYLAREWQRHVDARPLRTDDPRPDIAVDSEWWAQLLNLVDGEGETDLREALHCLRCLGARLVWSGRALRLVPHGTPAGVPGEELGRDEYARYREDWLVPHAAALSAALGRLAQLASQIERRRRVAA